MHTSEEEAAYVPAFQGVHVETSLRYLPAAQALQEPAAAPETVPVAHLVQLSDPFDALYSPAGQVAHAEAPDPDM